MITREEAAAAFQATKAFRDTTMQWCEAANIVDAYLSRPSDAAKEIERLQAIGDVIPNPDTTWAMAQLISEWADEHDFVTSTADDCDLAARLDEMLADKITAAEAAEGE